MSWLGNIAGDLLGGLTDKMHAEEMQSDAQTFNSGEANLSRHFNSAEAVAQRDWSTNMANTSWQRGVADMKAAGMNPMLAYSQGGAHTPSGAHATASPASAGIASGGRAHPISASMQSASQIEVNTAQADKLRAETDEVKARTPTHQASIERIQQEIQESQKRVEHIIDQIKLTQQTTNTSAMSAIHLDAQTSHIREVVKQVQETIKLLKAQEFKTYTEAGHVAAQDMQIRQRIEQNLPELEAALTKLQTKILGLGLPRAGMDAATHDSYIGALSAFLRALNPFGALVPNITNIHRYP